MISATLARRVSPPEISDRRRSTNGVNAPPVTPAACASARASSIHCSSWSRGSATSDGGGWIDAQHPRDVFFFEQDGSFVFRMLVATATSTGHQLAEFTKDEIVGMIDAAPQQRETASEAGAKP